MFSKLYSWSPKQLLGLLIALFTCLNAIAPTLATNTTHVTLVSNQGDRLDMSIEATQHSSLLKNMLEDLSISELQDGDIPILKVNTETLKRFIDYCEQNKEEAVHDEDYYLDTPYSLNEYDRVVLDGLDDDALFSLTMAADFMGAEQLLQASKL